MCVCVVGRGAATNSQTPRYVTARGCRCSKVMCVCVCVCVVGRGAATNSQTPRYLSQLEVADVARSNNNRNKRPRIFAHTQQVSAPFSPLPVA